MEQEETQFLKLQKISRRQINTTNYQAMEKGGQHNIILFDSHV
jgi:hypothetical protein